MKRKDLIDLHFPKLTKERYTFRCQTVSNGLAIAFYQMHELVVRSWIGEGKFINIIEESKKESKKALDDLFYYIPGPMPISEFIVPKRELARMNCFTGKDQGIKNVIDYQNNIKKQQSKEKLKKNIQTSSKEARLVTKLPKGFDEWLQKQNCVFIHGKKRKGKPITAKCTHCGGSWNTTKEVKEWDTCPHCKAYGQYRKDNIRSHKYEIFSGIYLGKNAEGEVLECIRTCSVLYQASYNIKTVQFIDGDRRFISDTKNYHYAPCGNNNFRRKGGIFNRRGDLFHAYSESAHIYPSNIKRILKGTPYEKYEVEQFARHLEKVHSTWFVKDFISSFQTHPLAEQLMKGGFRTMVYHLLLHYQYDIVDNYTRDYLKKPMPDSSLAASMGLSKNQFNDLRKLEGVNQAIAVAITAYANITLKKAGKAEVSLEVVNAYKDVVINRQAVYYGRQYTNIGLALRHPTMLTPTFVRYMNKVAGENANSFLKDYTDYLRWLEEMDYQINKTRLRPKDFKDAHDRMEKEYNDFVEAKKQEKLRKASEYMGEIKPILEEFLKIPLENSDYEIVIPSSREDLVKESEKLHHCVRNYAESIYNHSCVIVFIRKKDNLDEPFYTMEISNKVVMQQCRTQGNHSYMLDKNMVPVVENYMDEVRKRATKKEFQPLLEKLQFSIAA